MDDTLKVVDMAAMDADSRAVLRALTVSPRQEFLGRSFIESMGDWENAPRHLCLGACFLHREQPIGLALFLRGAEAATEATIHGLKIASQWQGRGWGHVAFGLAIDQLESSWPGVKILKLAVDADNHAAIAVYRAHKMRGSDTPVLGKHGPEFHFSLDLLPKK